MDSSSEAAKYFVNIFPINHIPQGQKWVEHTIALISQRQRERLQKPSDFSRSPKVPVWNQRPGSQPGESVLSERSFVQSTGKQATLYLASPVDHLRDGWYSSIKMQTAEYQVLPTSPPKKIYVYMKRGNWHLCSALSKFLRVVSGWNGRGLKLLGSGFWDSLLRGHRGRRHTLTPYSHLPEYAIKTPRLVKAAVSKLFLKGLHATF